MNTRDDYTISILVDVIWRAFVELLERKWMILCETDSSSSTWLPYRFLPFSRLRPSFLHNVVDFLTRALSFSYQMEPFFCLAILWIMERASGSSWRTTRVRRQHRWTPIADVSVTGAPRGARQTVGCPTVLVPARAVPALVHRAARVAWWARRAIGEGWRFGVELT